MKTALSALGWLLAVGAVVVAGVLFSTNRGLKSDLDSAEEELAQISAELNEQKVAYRRTQDEAEELRQQVAESEQASMPSSHVSDSAEEPGSDTEENTNTEADTDQSEQGQGESMRRAARAQMGVMVGMQYNSLLDDLALPKETRDAVTDILIDAFRESQQATVQDMMSRNMTAKEAKAKLDAIDAKVREQLTDVLNEDEMAQWDMYQDFADEVLYEALLDGQITMLAPGLDEDARKTAKIVLAEELAAELDRYYETDTTYTLDSFNQAQLAGLNNGMAKMPDTITDEQYAHLQGFVDQVAVAFQQMAGQSGQPE